MRVLDRTCGQLVLSIGVVCLIAAPALAHVGSGLAVDKNGQVYFLDTGSGLWRIDVQGKLAKIDGNRFHWLALDETNALANTRLPSGPNGDFVKVGANPAVILASDWPIAIDQDGNLYTRLVPRAAYGSCGRHRREPRRRSPRFRHRRLGRPCRTSTASLPAPMERSTTPRTTRSGGSHRRARSRSSRRFQRSSEGRRFPGSGQPHGHFCARSRWSPRARSTWPPKETAAF